MIICALPAATRLTVTVVPEAVAVALVGSVDATVKSLLVAPVGAILTVKVLVPPAAPVLVTDLLTTLDKDWEKDFLPLCSDIFKRQILEASELTEEEAQKGFGFLQKRAKAAA